MPRPISINYGLQNALIGLNAGPILNSISYTQTDAIDRCTTSVAPGLFDVKACEKARSRVRVTLVTRTSLGGPEVFA